jgi:hypothetical protein
MATKKLDGQMFEALVPLDVNGEILPLGNYDRAQLKMTDEALFMLMSAGLVKKIKNEVKQDGEI